MSITVEVIADGHGWLIAMSGDGDLHVHHKVWASDRWARIPAADVPRTCRGAANAAHNGDALTVEVGTTEEWIDAGDLHTALTEAVPSWLAAVNIPALGLDFADQIWVHQLKEKEQ